jgi:hypothetical protein
MSDTQLQCLNKVNVGDSIISCNIVYNIIGYVIYSTCNKHSFKKRKDVFFRDFNYNFSSVNTLINFYARFYHIKINKYKFNVSEDISKKPFFYNLSGNSILPIAQRIILK